MSLTMTTYVWRCRDRLLEIGPRALVMGIVNVTPDSFSDGGRHDTTAKAVEYALRLVQEGADILDIGGESSRPGAEPVPLDEELRRVVPVVQELSRLTSVPISVDTVKAEIARQSLQAGACIINDITALCGDSDMPEEIRTSGAGIVLMHMQGTPQTMQLNPTYGNVVNDIGAFFEERLRFAADRGIDLTAIALDPGIGFGKTLEHTLLLLRNLAEFQRFGRPVCLGVSRKGFIGQILDRPRNQRTVGSVAVACHAIANGAAQIIRVHDAAEHRDAVRMLEVLRGDVGSSAV
jgi:dihydropteroate synthase